MKPLQKWYPFTRLLTDKSIPVSTHAERLAGYCINTGNGQGNVRAAAAGGEACEAVEGNERGTREEYSEPNRYAETGEKGGNAESKRRKPH